MKRKKMLTVRSFEALDCIRFLVWTQAQTQQQQHLSPRHSSSSSLALLLLCLSLKTV
jgi:hypothetical protein